MVLIISFREYGPPRTSRSTVSSIVTLSEGGELNMVPVPWISCVESPGTLATCCECVGKKEETCDLTYLTVGPVLHLPDPVNAVDLRVVKMEVRVSGA